MKNIDEVKIELPRIIDFIQNYMLNGEKVVVPVSGGLDSDLVARLCVNALGPDRVRLFIVHQPHMEDKYIANARNLAEDLQVNLAIIEMGTMNQELIEKLSEADPEVGFHPNGLLDPARANCSLRTAFFSTYQDKGYLVAANSNRSEIELGFFMPFGDNLGHFKPIAHLYKTEVRILAELVGSRAEVRQQASSAGFWENENDMEDIAYWLYNGGPISGNKVFTEEDDIKVQKIAGMLSQEKIDRCLESFHTGRELTDIARESQLPLKIVNLLKNTVLQSKKVKRRELMVSLER